MELSCINLFFFYVFLFDILISPLIFETVSFILNLKSVVQWLCVYIKKVFFKKIGIGEFHRLDWIFIYFRTIKNALYINQGKQKIFVLSSLRIFDFIRYYYYWIYMNIKFSE